MERPPVLRIRTEENLAETAPNLAETSPNLTAPSTEVVTRVPTRHGTTNSACLVLIHPTEKCLGRRQAIGNDPVLIGRDSASCHLSVDDSSVSRVHARLATVGGEYYINDNRSTNGTFVNEESIFLRKLADGDYIRVGRHIFRFLMGGNVEALYHEEICRLVTTDPLTDVGNRRCLMDFLERELARASRYAKPLSVALLDLDHFKMINDQWGHLAGDMALREFTTRVRKSIRQVDLLARTGGDEFALAMPEAQSEEALAAAERLRRLIDSDPFIFDGHQYEVTISIGVATTLAAEATSPSKLIIEADEKLYEAKRAGGNRSVA